MEIKGYLICDEEKWKRAIYGTVGREGKYDGAGVGEDASDDLKLAAYDRLAGLIKKGKYKVKTGCFHDLKGPKGQVNVITKPKPILVLQDLNGNFVEIPEGAGIPLEVQAVEIRDKALKKKKSRPKKKVDEESVDDDA